MARVIGTIQCRGLECGEKVAVSETAGASLSLKCAFCGFSPYAQPGSKAARLIRKHMTALDDSDPDALPKPAPKQHLAPAPTPTPEVPPKSPPKTAAKAGFSFDQLVKTK